MHRLDLAVSQAHVSEKAGNLPGGDVGPPSQAALTVTGVVQDRLYDECILKRKNETLQKRYVKNHF